MITTPIKTPLVALKGVSKTFHSLNGAHLVLDNVDFEVYAGDKISLVGASGSGKSTLLSLINGLLQPDTGTVTFNGVLLSSLNDDERSEIRATSVGIALQAENLIPFLTALENVELAHSFGGRAKDSAVALALLERLGVAHVANYLPRQISGGEAQRVSLAVALSNKPKLLIADEMAAQLDANTANSVMQEIFKSSMAVVFVTHNKRLAGLAQRQFCIKDKKVIAI